MIKIHRTKRVVKVDDRPVPLTPGEHELMVVLGMMDNKLASYDLLLLVTCKDRVQIPADKQALISRMFRLKRKLGEQHLECVRQSGYVLKGKVQFIGGSEDR